MPESPLYPGEYSNGRTPGNRPVSVAVASGGLLIRFDDGAETLWLYSDSRLTHHHPVRIERGLESLVVNNDDFLAHIQRANPENFRAIRGDWSASAWNWVALAICLIAAAVLIVWLQVLPRLASATAGSVPVSWEESMGKRVADGYIASEGECKDAQVTAALNEIVSRLDQAKPSPYTFRIQVANAGDVNAFAAPGGYIVVFRGLLEAADSPDEVAGVLAHEMEHVRQRHVTRGLLRQASITALAALLLGDAGAIGRIIATMGSLRFQRADEASADREGMRNLASAGIDPRAMIRFFEKLSESEGDLPALATYISTHPDTRERIDELETLAARLRVQVRPLDSAAAWSGIKRACSAR